jgi:hypothetical protein
MSSKSDPQTATSEFYCELFAITFGSLTRARPQSAFVCRDSIVADVSGAVFQIRVEMLTADPLTTEKVCFVYRTFSEFG